MGTLTEVETYNYSAFDGSDDGSAFRPAPPAGSSAPDFAVTLMESGQSMRLSDCWRDRDVLVEFGSLT
ncbi:MAG: hypothetical protein HY331_06970 [Chloroflexi bacterium]|nr:hypothetical protein [Chloroflexota bacterium]